jgi:hypothetical protein
MRATDSGAQHGDSEAMETICAIFDLVLCRRLRLEKITSPLSCQGSPTYPFRDFQNSLPPHGSLTICNCQCGFA